MSRPSNLDEFAERIHEFIRGCTRIRSAPETGGAGRTRSPLAAGDEDFAEFARELFELQFVNNPPYRAFCEARQLSPRTLADWTWIPAMPASGFKELELSCLPELERKTVFHSSGTTIASPSRHFHHSKSLALYEDSLWAWFQRHFPFPGSAYQVAALTPSPAQAPHSSLIHMFEVIGRRLASKVLVFGETLAGGAWRLDMGDITTFLKTSIASEQRILLCGTAFSYVHLLDHLRECSQRFLLPPGSCVLETGGYKGYSRSLPKAELHGEITHWLGVPSTHILTEYGMCELSSQAYDHVLREWGLVDLTNSACAPIPPGVTRHFHFPPWARVQIVSPETGAEVAEGETGLIRVFDLANVYSVMAIQTEDLGRRRGAGFELIGRAPQAEARGCSLMANA